jgi:hypothetical protein
MKKHLIFLSLILLFTASFTACKKETFESKPLREKMIGKWQVNKIDVTTGSAATVSTTYASTDYIDFKDNSSDDFELGLGANRQVGNYSSSIDMSFYLDFSSKDLECVATTITENKFTFTGTVVGSNPKITETYYLTR